MSRSQEKHSRWNRYQSSSGHFVMMSKGNRRNQERKWLRNLDESEWSLNTSLMLRWGSISRARWSFLEANVPVVVSLMIPLITPINEMQMQPRFMMAALITGT